MPAYYESSLATFSAKDALATIGQLAVQASESGFAELRSTQIEAWLSTLQLIGRAIAVWKERVPDSAEWRVFLEFEIPRRQRRPDVILIAGNAIFVIEFKIGATTFDAGSVWQTRSYALDLRDFHSGSDGRTIIPILVATDAASKGVLPGAPGTVWQLQRINADALGSAVAELSANSERHNGPRIDADQWASSGYRPTLSIIEAAETLFAQHSVREINHRYAQNLSATTDAVVRAIQESETQHVRTICFVTGVPGAGKTLTGLSAVHDPVIRQGRRPPAVFLSGNSPLIKVVREALVRNVHQAEASRETARREVSTFIQNVHGFLREYAAQSARRPPEHIVIFDEAQRAWDAKQCTRKLNIDRSEPEQLLEIMARLPEWCVIIALIGDGQEIHEGEAGVSEWGKALANRDEPWRIVAPPRVLCDEPASPSSKLFGSLNPGQHELETRTELHLEVSTRAYRASVYAEWVDAVLRGDSTAAMRLATRLSEFPIGLTRSLKQAREWLRSRCDPARRSGLVASSGALRLRAEGIEVSSGFRQGIGFEDWFLNDRNDIRSSHQLEVAATEFETQGLELDWIGVCWGNDLYFDVERSEWRHQRLRGNRWNQIRQDEAIQQHLNKYRVLMTRAREGIVIWVPTGSSDDNSRDPMQFDGTVAFLLRCGLAMLDDDPAEKPT